MRDIAMVLELKIRLHVAVQLTARHSVKRLRFIAQKELVLFEITSICLSWRT